MGHCAVCRVCNKHKILLSWSGTSSLCFLAQPVQRNRTLQGFNFKVRVAFYLQCSHSESTCLYDRKRKREASELYKSFCNFTAYPPIYKEKSSGDPSALVSSYHLKTCINKLCQKIDCDIHVNVVCLGFRLKVRMILSKITPRDIVFGMVNVHLAPMP